MSKLLDLPGRLELRASPYQCGGIGLCRRILFSAFSAGLENLESFVSKLVLIATRQIMDADEHRVIHNLQLLHQFDISVHLLDKGVLFGWPKLNIHSTPEPVEILHRGSWVLLQFRLSQLTPNR